MQKKVLKFNNIYERIWEKLYLDIFIKYNLTKDILGWEQILLAD
jgi:hypothetical protein